MTEGASLAGGGRRRPGVRRTGSLAEAVLDLSGLVSGPVMDPHGVDALVELAAAPRDGLRRRLAIVGAVDARDLSRVVRWAGRHGVAVAVPGTGHLGSPDGPTIVVTLSRADRIVVDAQARTARVGIGATRAALRLAARRVGLDLASGPGRTVDGGAHTAVCVDAHGTICALPPDAVDPWSDVVVELEHDLVTVPGW